MKKTLLILMTIIIALPVTGLAAELDIKAITAKCTADNPQYGRKEAWPMLVGDEYFSKQEWEKARLLIWNIHGSAEKVEDRHGGLDGSNPANWINAATGKPANAIPDMDTDIILPDSDTPYRVAAILKGSGVKSYACRHLTIGRNATFCVHGGGNNSVFGNVWIHANGLLSSYRTTVFSGNHNTFLRQEWPEDGKLKKLHYERLIQPYDADRATLSAEKRTRGQPWFTRRVGTYGKHEKAEGKSTEVIGYACTGDEFGINSGTFIVGRNSRFVSNGPATVAVGRGAKVVLMDGAMLAHGHNQFGTDCKLRAGGEITGGAPDRPLKSDAYLGIGYRNWMNLPVPPRPGASEDRDTTTLEDGTKIYYGYKGKSADIDGDLIGYPAQGSDARLVVCWQRNSMNSCGHWGRKDEAFEKVFAKIVPKIGVWISDDSKLENVRFDDLHRGGIIVPSADVFKS